MTAIRLREWRADDAAAVAPMLDDPHLRHWSALHRIGAERWIAEQRAAERGPSLAICTASEDRALGKVALRLPGFASPATACAAMRPADQPAGELSYWILPAERGRGLAGAAVNAMASLARERHDVRSLVLDIEDDNLASLRVAERLGAERRAPTRIAVDRLGVERTMIVFVIAL